MRADKIFSKSMRLVCVISVPATVSIHLRLDMVTAWGSSQGAYGWNPLLCWALLLGHWITLCDLLLMVAS